MRRFKNSFFFLVILLAASLYAYFYEYKKRTVDEKSKAVSEQLLSVDKDSINFININNETVFSKNDFGLWELSTPVKWKVKDEHINSLLDQLVLKVELVKDNASQDDYLTFGIDTAKPIEVKTKNNDTYVLNIGDKSPISTEKYFLVKSKTNKIVLANEEAATLLNKGVDELRDTKIFDKNIKISKIVFSDFILKESNGVWSVEGKEYLLDDIRVSKFIEDLFAIDVKGFPINKILESASLKDAWKEYKLKSTDLVLFKQDTSFKFYASKNNDKFYLAYLKNISPSEVYEINEDIFKKLKPSINDFRKKNIFAFKNENVSSIEFFNENNFSIIKKTETNEWSLDGVTLDVVKINSFFDKLNSLEVQRFIDSTKLSKYGLDKISKKIILKDNSALNILELNFGTVTDDKVYALFNNKIYEVNSDILDKIDTKTYLLEEAK